MRGQSLPWANSMRHSNTHFPVRQWLGTTGLLAALSVCPLAFAQADGDASSKLSRNAPVTLNFVNAEIEAVARAMASMTGRQVVLEILLVLAQF